ncbi:MAG: N-acetylmuramoyl-L-alanine amidase [Methylobacterium mesophilicum]|nr:N-acetylmuramoyl-L-alanine amidase [Methylobacterium mesophilicum]
MSDEGFAPDQPGVTVRPSPNHGERRGMNAPDILLLHYTGMASGQAAEDWLCDPASEVSCHYIVHEDGRIVQMVPESRRAWHAGRSSWQGQEDVNSRSVGIEVVNPGHNIGYRDFPERQIDAVIELCRGIVGRHGIAPERVLAHSDVAPGRKVDPGEKFPWKRLAQAGLAFHVPPSETEGDGLRFGDRGEAVAALREALRQVGYGLEPGSEFDGPLKIVVEAFQRRFRPARVDGEADLGTLETLKQVSLALFGCKACAEAV